MHLCIDIGNSSTKLAVYDPEVKDMNTWTFRDKQKKLSATYVKRLLKDHAITRAISSNTRNEGEYLRELLAVLQDYIELDEFAELPIQNKYDTPETLGNDRLAGVCAANSMFPGKHTLVIDAGTCITMDLIDKDGNYYGGSIHPGITMRYRALNNYTGKLPLVKREKENRLIGTDTRTSIVSGVQTAVIAEIQGMIDRYSVQFGKVTVIITGGDAPFFVSQLKSKIFAHSNLVLAGLRKILDYNAKAL